jgi:hypothetical protein
MAALQQSAGHSRQGRRNDRLDALSDRKAVHLQGLLGGSVRELSGVGLAGIFSLEQNRILALYQAGPISRLLYFIGGEAQADFYRLHREMRTRWPDEDQLVFIMCDLLPPDEVDLPQGC